MNFLAELRRRNVIRMAGLYLVGAWLVIQIAETLLPVFHTPDWVLQSLIVVIALGFIPALVFSWVFELTPDGLRRDEAVDPAQSIAPQTAKRMDQLTLAGVLLVLVVIGADRYWPREPDAKPKSGQSDHSEKGSSEAEAGAESSTRPAAQHSIAVLPFANLSGDASQDYFSDGMTEELLNVLARIPNLKVAARTSVFEFKHKGGDVRQIGQTLGVTHVLEGSIRREGDQVRVTTQLIRVSDGFHEWSENYDRQLNSVLALQDEIAGQVGRQLVSRLTPAEPPPVRTDIDPVAYDEYLQGRALLRARQDIPRAVMHFRTAVARAPEFAMAWASIALSLEVLTGRADAIEIAALGGQLEPMRAAAQRAATLAPEAGPTLHALANVARAEGRLVEAMSLYERAIAADPGYADAREDHAELLAAAGLNDEALQAALELVEREPLVSIFLSRVIWLSVIIDRRDLVTEYAARALAVDPGNPRWIAAEYELAFQQGRHDEARSLLQALYLEHPQKFAHEWMVFRWSQRDPDIDAPLIGDYVSRNPEYLLQTAARDEGDLFFDLISRPEEAMGRFYVYSRLSVPVARKYLPDLRAKRMLREWGLEAFWRVHGWPSLCRPLGEDDFVCSADFAAAK